MITTRHLILNAPIIISEFGMVCYLRCLKNVFFSRGQVTFLDAAMKLK